MPNWCHNRLEIRGTATDIGLLREAVSQDDNPFDFERVLPTPDMFSGHEPDLLGQMLATMGGADTEPWDWHSWRSKHWGCKAAPDPDEMIVWLEVGGAVPLVRIDFDTPWAPPLGVLRELSRQHPSLVVALAYEEPGAGFGGLVSWTAGEVFEEATLLTDERTVRSRGGIEGGSLSSIGLETYTVFAVFAESVRPGAEPWPFATTVEAATPEAAMEAAQAEAANDNDEPCRLTGWQVVKGEVEVVAYGDGS